MQLTPELLSQLSPARREALLQRSQVEVGEVMERVRGILADIRARGDQANLEELALLKPDASLGDLRVSAEAIKAAYAQVKPEVVEHLRKAAANIRAFHAAQMERPQWQMELMPGVVAGRKTTPLDSVGCYVPGGRAAYPSTALMTVLPAVVAGVKRVVVCTPAGDDLAVSPNTLVACDIAGVSEIYKLGGAWAVGSLAYGTETVARVAKIVGPGNKYVTAAKLLVFGQVDIDSPAGPSEALIIADATANPRWLALDFLSQVEHDPDSAAVLITDSAEVARAVCAEVERLVPSLPRREIIEDAGRYCAVLKAADLEECIAFANEYAPEHLQIVTAQPFDVLESIRHAGSIFLGPYAPVPVGDYASGTNHVLPTARGAMSFSGLSVDDFIKKPTFQHLTREGLLSLAPTVTTLAKAEGLPVHAMAVQARVDEG